MNSSHVVYEFGGFYLDRDERVLRRGECHGAPDAQGHRDPPDARRPTRPYRGEGGPHAAGLA